MGFHASVGIDNDRSIYDHPISLWKRVISLIILSLMHALTYADRFGVAGVLGDVIDYYNISNSQAGLLSTLFVAATVCGSPIAGYFGDRYSRKWILVVGGFFWIGVQFACTFIPKDMFWLFLLLRCVDGFSDTVVYSCAPSLISDYFFVGKYRSLAFMVFFYGLNFGGGFGAILASQIAARLNWQWGLRLIACCTLVCWVFILLVVEEPPRILEKTEKEKHGGVWSDIKYLLSIKTFIFACATRSMIAHTSGAQSWWYSDLVLNAMQMDKDESEDKLNSIFHHIDYKTMVIISMIGNSIFAILGNTIVVNTAEAIKHGKWCFKGRANFRGSIIVLCGCLLCVSPLTYFQQLLVFVDVYVQFFASYVQNFLGGSVFALATDIVYSVTTSDKRATSIMYCYLIEHTFGDGPGPYIAGAIADAFRGDATDAKSEVWALINAFHISNLCVIPALIFSFLTLYFMKDDYYKNIENEAKIKEKSEREKAETIISDVGYRRGTITSIADSIEKTRL